MDDDSADIRSSYGKDAKTYVVLRPRYGIGDPFSSTFASVTQKDISYEKSEKAYVPRKDPEMDFHGEFERDRSGGLIVHVRPEHIPKPGGTMRMERKHKLTLPVIRRLHGAVPSAVLYALFRQYAYDYDVKIGVDPDDVHHNYRGDGVSYVGLFSKLKEYGYDPLAPLREGQDARVRFERSLGALIYSEVQSAIKGKRPKNMNHVISSWAINARDYIRDYIRGGVSTKKRLKDSTIIERTYKMHGKSENPPTYKYGLANALWETGELESNIRVLEVRATKRLAYASKKIREAAEKEGKRRKDARRKKAEDADAVHDTPPPTKQVKRTKAITKQDVDDKYSLMKSALMDLVSRSRSSFTVRQESDGTDHYYFKGRTAAERNSNQEFLSRNKYTKKYYDEFKKRTDEYKRAREEFLESSSALNIASHMDRMG